MFKYSKIAASITLSIAILYSPVSSAEDTCDLSQVHKEVYDKFKLPEIPSSLEDCGIGGFLNFDFWFKFDDIDLSSLFCDFAKDVVGDFDETFKVDFKIGKDGLKVDSPIYSVQTGGIDKLAKGLLYDATGLEEGDTSLLDRVGNAYKGQIDAVKQAVTDATTSSPSKKAAQQAEASKSAANTQAFANAVKSGSSINLSDVADSVKAIDKVNVTATSNTQSGSTTMTDLSGNSSSVSSTFNGITLTSRQQTLLENIPPAQLNRMTDKALTKYLGLTPSQVQQLTYGATSTTTTGDTIVNGVTLNDVQKELYDNLSRANLMKRSDTYLMDYFDLSLQEVRMLKYGPAVQFRDMSNSSSTTPTIINQAGGGDNTRASASTNLDNYTQNSNAASSSTTKVSSNSPAITTHKVVGVSTVGRILGLNNSVMSKLYHYSMKDLATANPNKLARKLKITARKADEIKEIANYIHRNKAKEVNIHDDRSKGLVYYGNINARLTSSANSAVQRVSGNSAFSGTVSNDGKSGTRDLDELLFGKQTDQ